MNAKPTHYLFKARLDWWVLLVYLLVIAVLLSSIPLMLWQETIDRAVGFVFSLAIALYTAYLIDGLFYTRYILHDTALEVISHWRHYIFEYRSMTMLKPSGLRALVTFGSHKRFALSGKNVMITMQGAPYKTISVSPVAQDQFMAQLLTHIDQDRSARITKRNRSKRRRI